MAKFLQDTIEEMAVSSKNPNKKEAVREFGDFFDRVMRAHPLQRKKKKNKLAYA